MKLMIITYDVDSGTVVRAALDGRDVSHEVTVTLAGGHQSVVSPPTGTAGLTDELTGQIPTPEVVRELTATQAGVAVMFGYDGPADDELQQDGVDGLGPGGSSS